MEDDDNRAKKKPFEESAAKDRDRYDEEMQAYREAQKQPAPDVDDDEEDGCGRKITLEW